MSFLAAIAFDPAIRGILVTLVGVVVLGGSVYLLLATNTGARLGFLLSLAGLFGFLFMLGIFWWIKGIGLIGEEPSWVEQEINFDRQSQTVTPNVDRLPATEDLPDPVALLSAHLEANPEVAERIAETEGEDFVPSSLTQVVTLVPELKRELDEQLGGWRILPESDPRRGEAVAATDASLAANAVFGANTSPASYTVKDVFLFGGKSAAEPETVPGEFGLLERAWRRVVSTLQVKNPTTYAAVTVQRNLTVEVPPGEAPPPAQVDPSASTVTAVFERNLGNRRAIPALFTLFTGILFFVFCWMLHTRDRRAAQMRESWDPAAAVGAG
jgi:uncharacterized membrane protein